MDKMRRKYCHLLGLHGDPWAIDAGRLRAYLSTEFEWLPDAEADEHTHPLMFAEHDLDGRPIAGRAKTAPPSIAVVPIIGPITYRPSAFSAMFGGTSVAKFQAMFRDLMAAPGIGAIVLDVDSPGGSVEGIDELASEIRAASRKKPVVAVANTWMASAAYWLGSQAGDLVVSPSGEVGSIGVFSLHFDQSKFLESIGIDPTFIFAGEHKVEANPYEPLSDDAKKELQADVDHYYDMFAAAVAKGRNTTNNKVRTKFGAGRMVRPAQAVELGMADRIETLDQAIKRVGQALQQQARAVAAQEARRRTLEEFEASLAADKQQAVAIVPGNPPGGSGEGVEGTWAKLRLKDFTDEAWEDLSGAERRRIGRYFAWYPNLDTFDALSLGHHFADSGKPSRNGVNNSLARLNQVKGMSSVDRDAAAAHLRAHQPSGD